MVANCNRYKQSPGKRLVLCLCFDGEVLTAMYVDVNSSSSTFLQKMLQMREIIEALDLFEVRACMLLILGREEVQLWRFEGFWWALHLPIIMVFQFLRQLSDYVFLVGKRIQNLTLPWCQTKMINLFGLRIYLPDVPLSEKDRALILCLGSVLQMLHGKQNEDQDFHHFRYQDFVSNTEELVLLYYRASHSHQLSLILIATM